MSFSLLYAKEGANQRLVLRVALMSKVVNSSSGRQGLQVSTKLAC